MENGVDEKGHTATKNTVENTPLKNEITTDMEVETKDLVIIQEEVILKPEKEVESEANVESREMDVDNRDTSVESLEVNMVEDSASEEDDICTPPDAAMEVNVSCDNECAERIEKSVDLPRSEIDYVTEEEDDPDDLYKPEGTIYLDIDGFSEFCKGSYETQLRLSKPVFVQGLRWKILAMPRDAAKVGTGTRPYKALGFFVQCNRDSDAVAWNCSAQVIQKVLGQTKDNHDSWEMVNFNFSEKNVHWGYQEFLSCDFLSNPENGFIKDDTIRLAVHVLADASQGIQWDSKKHAGYIGLKNQGATCYMNSVLQTLYFTTKLRKAVYDMPVSQGDSENSVALAMQRVFYDLQHSDEPVNTRRLTKSFGWSSTEVFTQHDVQELCRVLLDNLESKMKMSSVEDEIPRLFRGVMKSYIRCTNVNFESTKEEPFYDIQLNIKGKCNIMQSFRDYVQVERLDGENKYDAGDYGMQPAEKGVKFVSFPPVLHLHLLRFQYDATLDANVKINDKFSFPDKLCLNEFMEGNEEDYTYCLHAVLVHSGDVRGGHYVVFINTGLRPPGEKYKPKWCKFDDSVVSRVTVREAVMANYGGDGDNSAGRAFANAYMLVYVRESCIDEVLCQHENLQVPAHLVQRFENEQEEKSNMTKENEETHLCTEIVMITDQHLSSYNGFDLVDPKLLYDTSLPCEKIEKTMIIPQLYDYVKAKHFSNEHEIEVVTIMCFYSNMMLFIREFKSSELQTPAREMFRIWKLEDMTYREEGNFISPIARFRPTFLIPHSEETNETTLEAVFEKDRTLLYVETIPANSLKIYMENSEMLMFLKYYDEQSRTLRYVGHFIVAYSQCMSAYTDECLKLIGLPENTPLRLYEEVAPNRIRLIKNLGMPLCNAVIHLSDGGLLIAERQDRTNETNNAKLHLDTLYNTINIEAIANNDSFVSNHAEHDPPITGTIGLNWTMQQVVDYIGKEINYDPAKILLWQVSSISSRVMAFVTESQWEVGVKDLLGLAGSLLHDPRRNTRYRLVYTKMPIKITDIKRRRQMKIQLMDEKMNITEITIYPEKIGTVRDILEEARREFKFAPNGTGKLRLVYVGQSSQSMRAYTIFKEETSVMEVFQKTMTPSMYMGRVEEVPQDQLVVGSNEYLVPVAHFDNHPGQMFGVPFFLKVANDELLSSVRERIQARLDVPDKEYEKYKFALISSSRVVRYLNMTSNARVNLAELSHAHVAPLTTSPYLGLDHMNKSRQARGSHAAEKAIAIHN
ncbi:hypothetical protein Angca_009957 [Angiostrongylus cantonensis]|nr:hypothetical protein Angca_009957 [Angiostrongylus cantonensis]